MDFAFESATRRIAKDNQARKAQATKDLAIQRRMEQKRRQLEAQFKEQVSEDALVVEMRLPDVMGGGIDSSRTGKGSGSRREKSRAL